MAQDNNNDTPFVMCVDLDGVVADYHRAFRAVVAKELGLDEASMSPPPAWDFAESDWGIMGRDHFTELHQIAVMDYDLFSKMDEIPGASDTLWRLSDQGVHIRIVTHRLIKNWSHDKVVADTVEWLQRPREDGRPRVPYRDVCFIADKTEVGGDLYIDDAPHNVEALRAKNIPTLLFDASYNKHVPGARVHNWDEISAVVQARWAGLV